MQHDLAKIKSEYSIVDVIGQHIPGGLKRQGAEWVGHCPFHSDDHRSLKINERKNNYKCFVAGCGEYGDIFDFFTKQGKTINEAVSIITNGSIVPMTEPKPKKPEFKWVNAVPDQNNIPDPKQIIHQKYNSKASNAWAYHDASGNIIGFTCRFDLEDAKKDVLPFSFKQQIDDNGKPLGLPVWRWSELDKPRPLYNLHEIISKPKAIILIVEGEKTADAGKRLFPDYVVTTWIGGSDNVKHTDWSPLENRKIYLWNDNDNPGLHCMFGGWSLNEKTNTYTRITGIVELFKAQFKRIKNQPDFPKKWDIADADWTPEQAIEYLKNNRDEIPAISATAPNELPAVVIPPTAVVPEVYEPDADFDDEIPTNSNFRCLGFENNNSQCVYVFFVYRTNTIVKLTPGGINISNLLQLAPLNFWEDKYPKTTRSSGVKFEINTVADSLITICNKVGIFNPEKIRGRGAWIDNGKAVIHCGNKLIVNGKNTELNKMKSDYIYEAGQELGFKFVEPMKKNDAYKIIKLLERLNWSRNIDARLLAGWIVVAPLCGALTWRSHLWLIGASGTGKSWIMNYIVKKLLGKSVVDAQSGTTEAGIRQYLGADALPVVFDEAESEDKRGAERMQSVLEIMRASSTSDSGKIIKGSGNGTATQFDLRSCFAFASIGANLNQRSDISRITVLEVKKDTRENHRELWEETLKMYHKIINEDYINSFQSRAVTLLPTILKNAETFSTAAAAELDSQRTGDQLGIQLAGAYSLTSDGIISLEDARAWIKQRDWSAEKLSESTRDEVKVINKIMDSETVVETMVGRMTRTVGEIVIIARGDVVSTQEQIHIPEDLAKVTLRRMGMKVESNSLIISDSSEFVSKLLANTPYAKNYNTILCRLDGAIKMEPTTFASGIKTRAVKIPTRNIFGDFSDPGISQTEMELFGNKK